MNQISFPFEALTRAAVAWPQHVTKFIIIPPILGASPSTKHKLWTLLNTNHYNPTIWEMTRNSYSFFMVRLCLVFLKSSTTRDSFFPGKPNWRLQGCRNFYQKLLTAGENTGNFFNNSKHRSFWHWYQKNFTITINTQKSKLMIDLLVVQQESAVHSFILVLFIQRYNIAYESE